MSRASAWFVHVTAGLAAVTGAVYAWMRYVLEPADEFSIVNHPLEPLTRDLHLVLVPLLVFACGLVWRAHVWPRLRGGFPHRRRSGWLLVLSLAPMVLSGYLLQVAVEPTWRAIWVWTHGISGGLWSLAYLVHPWTLRHRRRAAARTTRDDQGTDDGPDQRSRESAGRT